MPNLQEMFQTEKNVHYSTDGQLCLLKAKRKWLAVLAKPREWKPGPGAGNVFWRGIKGPRLFCFRTISRAVIVADGV